MKTLLTLLSLLAAPLALAAPSYQTIDDFLFAANRYDDERTYRDNLTKLNGQFDYICPDTFCEGEYGNLASMGFYCVVENSTKVVNECVWHFYGSTADADVATGQLKVRGEAYNCSLQPNLTVDEFLAYVNNVASRGTNNYKGLSEVAIPGQDKTMWDVLVKCL